MAHTNALRPGEVAMRRSRMKRMTIVGVGLLLTTVSACAAETADGTAAPAADMDTQSSDLAAPDTPGSDVGGGDASAADASVADAAKDQGGAAATHTVTFTTYTDDTCTEVPPMNSVVELDTGVACNQAPKASISELVCYPDRITYTNHPNVTDCSSTGFANELFVGVCQEFPGPVPTWKYIDPQGYTCLTP